MFTREQQKENRNLWADALESGDYKQGQSRLCQKKGDGEEYLCCLGVALEMPDTPWKKALDIKRHDDLDDKTFVTYSHDLPEDSLSVEEWRDPETGKPRFVASYIWDATTFVAVFGNLNMGDFTIMNDQDNRSFEAIAHFIRTQPL